MKLNPGNKTGIICTIGPASDKLRVLRAMKLAGMNIARLNFSHGRHADYHRLIRRIEKLNAAGSRKIGLLQDLEGFRLRVGKREKSVALKKKQIVDLSNRPVTGQHEIIPLDYQGALKPIKKGHMIYIDDGTISLKVINVARDRVRCEVVVPGILKEHKGVNIPEADFPFDGLTAKDRRDLQFGIKNKVDFIAQSFVRKAGDIGEVREFINARNFNCPLIAKIENKEGLDNLEGILAIADGVMVARGDLGVSMPIYEIPILQKMIIKKCRERSKAVITATQMLESMTENIRPTRAEVSDVANAIIDGSDYVMLSGETAVGEHPVETVGMMKKVIDFTRRSLDAGDLV
jgi:pyruvate kinase